MPCRLVPRFDPGYNPGTIATTPFPSLESCNGPTFITGSPSPRSRTIPYFASSRRQHPLVPKGCCRCRLPGCLSSCRHRSGGALQSQVDFVVECGKRYPQVSCDCFHQGTLRQLMNILKSVFHFWLIIHPFSQCCKQYNSIVLLTHVRITSHRTVPAGLTCFLVGGDGTKSGGMSLTWKCKARRCGKHGTKTQINWIPHCCTSEPGSPG